MSGERWTFDQAGFPMKDEPIRAAPAVAGLVILTLLVCTLVWLRYDGEAAGAAELMEPIQRGLIPWATAKDLAPEWTFNLRCITVPCEPENVRVEYRDAEGRVIATYRLCEVVR